MFSWVMSMFWSFSHTEMFYVFALCNKMGEDKTNGPKCWYCAFLQTRDYVMFMKKYLLMFCCNVKLCARPLTFCLYKTWFCCYKVKWNESVCWLKWSWTVVSSLAAVAQRFHAPPDKETRWYTCNMKHLITRVVTYITVSWAQHSVVFYCADWEFYLNFHSRLQVTNRRRRGRLVLESGRLEYTLHILLYIIHHMLLLK